MVLLVPGEQISQPQATVKESDDGAFVARTLDRSKLWEVQTPQIVRPARLNAGFDKVEAVSLASIADRDDELAICFC